MSALFVLGNEQASKGRLFREDSLHRVLTNNIMMIVHIVPVNTFFIHVLAYINYIDDIKTCSVGLHLDSILENNPTE